MRKRENLIFFPGGEKVGPIGVHLLLVVMKIIIGLWLKLESEVMK